MSGSAYRTWMLGAMIAAFTVACATSTDSTDTTDPASSTAGTASTAPPTNAPETTSAPTTATPPTATPPTATSTTAPPATAAPTTSSSPTVSCEPAIGLDEQIALIVWPSVYSSDWETARQIVRENGLGGVLLMKPSGWDAETITTRLAELDSESPHGLVVATDEEGGDVQRLSGVSPLASQYDVSSSMSAADATQLVARHAAVVSGLGIDVVFAPVVDVLPVDGSPPLRRSRFFAGGPEQVTDYASAYIGAWSGAGITPVLKHFPGHGRASGDTHVSEGITAPLADLEVWDLVPYHILSGSGAGVMVGHLTTPGLSDGLPASRSPAAIDFLRSDLGYDDELIVSDSLDMDAVGVPVPQAAVESIAAGVDVVLFTDPSITGEVLAGIEAAVADGTISTDRITDAASKVWGLLGRQDPRC